MKRRSLLKAALLAPFAPLVKLVAPAPAAEFELCTWGVPAIPQMMNCWCHPKSGPVTNVIVTFMRSGDETGYKYTFYDEDFVEIPTHELDQSVLRAAIEHYDANPIIERRPNGWAR